MTDFSSTSNITYTSGSTSGMATGVGPCFTCGTYNCNCSQFSNLNQIIVRCFTCGMSYQMGTNHLCVYSVPCQPSTNTGTTIGTNITFPGYPVLVSLKEVKEITTDAELIYEWNGNTYDMKLPTKFSDCFLKVGYTWSPLYPLIFSALENDSKEMSFHIVVGISDKVFEGDKVILKSVTTTKIEDNLTLLQLSERTNQFFKKDGK